MTLESFFHNAAMLFSRRVSYLRDSENTTGADGAHTSDEEGYRHLQNRVVPFFISDVLFVPVAVWVPMTFRIGIQHSVRRNRDYGAAAGERSISAYSDGHLFLVRFVTAECLQAGCRRIGIKQNPIQSEIFKRSSQ